jgi:hypothetical protein
VALAPSRRAGTQASFSAERQPPGRVLRQSRVRRAIRHVEVMSVLKVSLVLYLSALVVVLIAGAVLWGILSGVGFTPKVEHFVDDLFGFKSFTLAGLQLLLVGVLLGLVLVIVGTLFNVLCAVLYNLTCDVVGGLQLIEVEEAPPPPRPQPAPGSR